MLDTSTGVADPIVRNWATVGGNLVHADPGNDHPATMLALGASLVAEGPQGKRVIPIEEFFTDSAFETTLQQNEILTEIRIPAPAERSGGTYVRLERKVGDYAIAAVAVHLTFDSSNSSGHVTLDEHGRMTMDNSAVVTRAGIGLTNVASHVIKAREAENFLVGKLLDDATIHQAAELAAAAAQPSTDLHGPAAYKRAMVRTLCVRALQKALARANGGE